ncbi:MAG: AAA-like domain-containing protein [Phycisphaerales bacterium]|nr:MAG: AAA-like domain-containing protein [Phycisphaerales bacterium]
MNTKKHPFFQVGSTLPEDSPSYIERPADTELLNALLDGDLCLVLAPRQTGKSSLMVHVGTRLRREGKRVGIVDAQALVGHKDLGPWFSDAVHQIQRSMELECDAAQWWEDHKRLGPAQRFMDFVEDMILEEVAGDAVLFFDEIDAIVSQPFSDSFFTTIRSLYNARATNAKLRRITFCLLGKASPTEFVRDRTRTPFNVGKSISLTDFSRESLAPFRDVLGSDSDPSVDRIFHWTNGQAFLVQRLAAAAYDLDDDQRQAKQIDEAVERDYLDKRAEDDVHLRFIQDYVVDDEKTKAASLSTYRKVRAGKTVRVDERSPVQTRLGLAGLVRGERTDGEKTVLRVRNRIYEQVFTDAWVRQLMPVNWARRAAMTLAVVLIVGGVYAYWGWYPQQFIANLEAAVKPEEWRLVRQNYEKLRSIPGYTGRAAGALAEYWERCAGDAERLEQRDQALLLRIQALSSSPGGKRRRAVGQVAQGYSHLSATFRHQYFVQAVAFSPNANRVLTGSTDGTARLWDLQWGEVVQTFRHERSIQAEAFSPDGNRVVTVSDGTMARLWDVQRGEVVQTFRRDTLVRAVAFSPDGNRLCTGSDDGAARLWDVRRGDAVQAFRHRSRVYWVAFSIDGKSVFAGTWNWIHCWRLVGQNQGSSASRSVPGRLLGFVPTDPETVQAAWLVTATDVQTGPIRFDRYDAEPIEGDPQELLRTWQRKLALRLDNTGEWVYGREAIAPSQLDTAEPPE